MDKVIQKEWAKKKRKTAEDGIPLSTNMLRAGHKLQGEDASLKGAKSPLKRRTCKE